MPYNTNKPDSSIFPRQKTDPKNHFPPKNTRYGFQLVQEQENVRLLALADAYISGTLYASLHPIFTPKPHIPVKMLWNFWRIGVQFHENFHYFRQFSNQVLSFPAWRATRLASSTSPLASRSKPMCALSVRSSFSWIKRHLYFVWKHFHSPFLDLYV